MRTSSSFLRASRDLCIRFTLLLACAAPAVAQEYQSPEALKPATNEYRFRLPLNPHELDKAILESHCVPFDRAIWVVDVAQRQSMLLDVLRRAVYMQNRDEIIALLGSPVRTISTVEKADEFDLGTYGGEKIILRMYSGKDSSPTFTIGQYSEDGYLQLVSGDWHWKNPDYKDAASDLNRQFYFVGAPREHLCQFNGHPPDDVRTWTAGYQEIELTEDGSKVKRLRVVPSEFYGTTLTAWEDRDYRVVQGSYSQAFDFAHLTDNQEQYLVKPLSKFDQKSWDKWWNRNFMLFDLTHSKPLIGRSRADIRAMLGVPDYSETKPSTDKRTEYFARRAAESAPFNRFDWFPLQSGGCVIPAESGAYLEIVYTNDPNLGDIAAGYRLISSNKYDDGTKRIFGNALSKRIGYFQTAKSNETER